MVGGLTTATGAAEPEPLDPELLDPEPPDPVLPEPELPEPLDTLEPDEPDELPPGAEAPVEPDVGVLVAGACEAVTNWVLSAGVAEAAVAEALAGAAGADVEDAEAPLWFPSSITGARNRIAQSLASSAPVWDRCC